MPSTPIKQIIKQRSEPPKLARKQQHRQSIYRSDRKANRAERRRQHKRMMHELVRTLFVTSYDKYWKPEEDEMYQWPLGPYWFPGSFQLGQKELMHKFYDVASITRDDEHPLGFVTPKWKGNACMNPKKNT
jgi:hypothetical protein